MTTIDHRPASSRFHTDAGWLDSRHSFSFGHHYDPDNTGNGLLIVSNDDVVAPGAGFGAHAHRDMEIVTWVLEGELEHRDSAGNEGVIRPGLAQRMSAGRGIRHSEMNHSATEPVHFVQMWVPPHETGIDPGYEQRDVSYALADGGLVAVASGRGHDGAVTIHQRDAVMWVARLDDGAGVEIPGGPRVHVFMARGSARLGDLLLQAGDAARLTDTEPVPLVATATAEVIVWETTAEARG
ncbi:MAG: pirin family protein [Acidimicrobiales bacterium]